ncbi:MAG: hypothetical protein ACJ0BV_05420 [Paracoccaceae bacterium]
MRRYSKNILGSAKNLWMPTNRKNALIWLDDFFDKRFEDFGQYEDAVKNDNNFVFHSALSAILNLGILTPREVITKALRFAAQTQNSNKLFRRFHKANYRLA